MCTNVEYTGLSNHRNNPHKNQVINKSKHLPVSEDIRVTPVVIVVVDVVAVDVAMVVVVVVVVV